MAGFRVGDPASFVGDGYVGDPPDYAGFPKTVGFILGEDAVGTPYTVTLPAGIQSGELLVVQFYCLGGAAVTLPPSETWTQIDFFQGLVGGVDFTLLTYARVATGSEAAHTLDVVVGGPALWLSRRVAGAHASAMPEAGTAATGTSATPDPGNVAPTWGSAKNLFVGFAAIPWQRAATIFPLPNVNEQIIGSASPHGSLYSSEIREEVASKNPGTFTLLASENWAANTIAIRPAAASNIVSGAGVSVAGGAVNAGGASTAAVAGNSLAAATVGASGTSTAAVAGFVSAAASVAAGGIRIVAAAGAAIGAATATSTATGIASVAGVAVAAALAVAIGVSTFAASAVSGASASTVAVGASTSAQAGTSSAAATVEATGVTAGGGVQSGAGSAVGFASAGATAAPIAVGAGVAGAASSVAAGGLAVVARTGASAAGAGATGGNAAIFSVAGTSLARAAAAAIAIADAAAVGRTSGFATAVAASASTAAVAGAASGGAVVRGDATNAAVVLGLDVAYETLRAWFEANWAATPRRFENEFLDPPADLAPFVFFELSTDFVVESEIGSGAPETNVWREGGEAVFHVLVASGTGPRVVRGFAEDLAALLKGLVLTNGVRIGQLSIGAGEQLSGDGNYFDLNVTAQWARDDWKLGSD